VYHNHSCLCNETNKNISGYSLLLSKFYNCFVLDGIYFDKKLTKLMNWEEKNWRFIIFSKVTILISLLLVSLVVLVEADEISESERVKNKDSTSSLYSHPALDEDSWYSEKINQKIQDNEQLSFNLFDMLYRIVIGDKAIDIRELNMVLKFLEHGDNDTKKLVLEVLPKSVEKNFSVIKDKDYDYFFDLLKPIVNSQYPALIVEICISLYKISSIYEHVYDDSLISKLEYYARRTDSEN